MLVEWSCTRRHPDLSPRVRHTLERPVPRWCAAGTTSGLNRHTNRLSGAPSASSIEVRSAHHQGYLPRYRKAERRGLVFCRPRSAIDTHARSFVEQV